MNDINDVFSPVMMEMISFYDENYYPCTPIHLNTGRKLYIGERENRKCRFCGTTDVKLFKTDAHAFPEFIGNKELISNYECDICNEKFSRTIEDHLAKYTLLERTIAQVKGKKGIPSFKSQSKQSKINVKDRRIEINYHPDDDCIQFDHDNQRIKIQGYRQPYIPRSAYKCLVKMAISILPYSELQHFADTIKWLNIEKPVDDPIKTDKFFTAVYSFAPGPKPFPWITALLLKRKIDTTDFPYMIFFIAFANFTFQIAIPFNDMDKHLVGKQLTIPAFPNIFHDGTKFGNVNYTIINLSSNELVSNESDHMYMHYESFRKLDPEKDKL